MRALREKKEKALELRALGYSLKEMVKLLSVSKSTMSVWVRNVPLSAHAKSRLLTRIKKGQLVSAERNKARTLAKNASYFAEAQKRLRKTKFTSDASAFLCAALYWCEGSKGVGGGLTFMNSDPDLMKLFIALLRNTFDLDESKFHPLLHIHEYHNNEQEVAFWSKIIKIKPEQFARSYLKPHTGKRIREGYHGCLSLRYSDVTVARKLLAFGRALLNKGRFV